MRCSRQLESGDQQETEVSSVELGGRETDRVRERERERQTK